MIRSDKLANILCPALGLDLKNVRAVTIEMRAWEPVLVTVEYSLRGVGEVGEAIAPHKFRLVPVEDSSEPEKPL